MKLLLLVFIAVLSVLLEAKMQNVTVNGVAVCGKKRLENATVELWERDTFDPNDLLASVQVNKDGEFTVTGGEDEVGSIEPFIRITHKCNVKEGCTRQTDFVVPKDRINAAPYEMTYVTLDIVHADDKEKC